MAYKKSPFKMMPKSPILKALIGNQKNLNEGLKQAETSYTRLSC